MPVPKPVVLCILDGWGLSATTQGNAPALAHTPTMDALMARCPNAELITHGPDVGLPRGQMGNSEVGHTNIGAGRVVAMDLGQIDLAIEDGSFFDNTALIDFIAQTKMQGGTAHLMGLVSDGGVHSHFNHMIAAAKICREAGLSVVIHALGDGRDVAPKSIRYYLEKLCTALPDGVMLATLTGRYYALDRDNRWERVQSAYDAIIHAKGERAKDAQAAIDAAYDAELTDEFIPATVLDGYEGAKDGDGFFCLNFRADRAREIMAAIGAPDFDAFVAGPRPAWAALLSMSSYSKAHEEYINVAYPKVDITNTLGAWIAGKGKTQFRLAETEKYPHVTFFLNGGIETPADGEDRFMPASPAVATYDLQPEMSCAEVTDHFVAAIRKGYDLIVANYANPDMVGHTGDLDAAIAACEVVDAGLGRVVEALEAVGGAMIVTADHGNCEVMIDPSTGGPHTAHTLNPVPVILVGGATQGAHISDGKLADLAPTLLNLMGLDVPTEMTGTNLIT